ncbi:MAG: hypothetical protein WAL91_09655 [Propionicimonas sp.]
MTDRVAFAIGVLAVLVAGLALWLYYGTIDWRLVGVLAPAALVIIGAGMLLLSRSGPDHRADRPRPPG